MKIKIFMHEHVEGFVSRERLERLGFEVANDSPLEEVDVELRAMCLPDCRCTDLVRCISSSRKPYHRPAWLLKDLAPDWVPDRECMVSRKSSDEVIKALIAEVAGRELTEAEKTALATEAKPT